MSAGTHGDLAIRRVLALRGPNLWANFPVIEAWVDLGRWKDAASDELPGFNERLMAWLPSMIEHRCSVGERGGFFERLRRGTYPAHILEHVALELQTLAGTPVGYGKARAMVAEGVYRVVVRYREEALGRACLEVARDLLQAALEGRAFDVAGAVAGLRARAAEVLPDAGTAAVVAAARERGIPAIRLKEGSSLFQLGHGARQRRVWASQTDATAAVGEAIALDGELTHALLRPLGVPVPEGRLVEGDDDAWDAAEEVGTPVTVRPSSRVFGPGVAAGLTTRAQVVAAYAAARAESAYVAVERTTPGAVHHLLVVGGRLAAAVRREPGEEARGSESEGLVDVTDAVHPEVAMRALEAARGVGLDVAGVDLVAESIARPLEGQGGAILRVRVKPDLEAYLEPSLSPPRPVGEAIVGALFPEGRDGRIPLVGVAGGRGRREVARLVSAILGASGLRVGLGGAGYVEVGGRRPAARVGDGDAAARSILIDPAVEAAVLEVARAEVLASGLGFDRCAVAVVGGLDDAPTAEDWGFEEPDDALRGERCVVEAVHPDGWAVLRADEPRVAAMAEHARGRVILAAPDGALPPLASHRARGGRAVWVRDGQVVRAEGNREQPPLRVDRPEVPVEWLLAVAAAWALEIEDAAIRAGLEAPPAVTTPGAAG